MESGILISPNYPNAYNHDASCVWIITVNDRDTLTLTFTNMDLEGHPDCVFDYVEVSHSELLLDCCQSHSSFCIIL